ncbi:MAG: MauE/DoxX family redox-associated membrane protein [Solirubrobacteraceae bacterium]
MLLAARLALAAVYLMAAVGKLTDRGGSRLAVERFGIPEALSGVVGVGLPLVELAIAVGLIVVASAAWAAVGAAVLLVIFCLAIARSLARGEAPDCHCFGSVGSAPVGRATLARNAGLIALAAFVAVAGWNNSGDSIVGAADNLGAATIILGGAIVAQMAFSWQLFQQNGRLLQRLSDLEAPLGRRADDDSGRPLALGQPAPAFALPDLDGRTLSLDELLHKGRGVLLVFTDPDCAHCAPLLPALGRARSQTATPIAVISRGGHAENHARAREHGIAPLLLQRDLEVAKAYRVFGFPAAILVNSAGRIASQRAGGAQAVAELLQAPDFSGPSLVQVTADRGAYAHAGHA